MVMKRYFLLFLVILSSFLLACSGDDSSSSENSFDPDGIATVNNGDGVDFSQYEDVWEIGSNDKDEHLTEHNGILNVSWHNAEYTEWKVYVTQGFERYANEKNSLYPFFLYSDENDDLYSGYFRLYKQNGKFYMVETVRRICHGEKWLEITPKTCTHRYIVSKSKIVFLD